MSNAIPEHRETLSSDERAPLRLVSTASSDHVWNHLVVPVEFYEPDLTDPESPATAVADEDEEPDAEPHLTEDEEDPGWFDDEEPLVWASQRQWTADEYAVTGNYTAAAAKLADSGVAPLIVAARGYLTVPKGGLATNPRAYFPHVPIPIKGSTQNQRMLTSNDRGDLLTMPWYTHDDVVDAEKSLKVTMPRTYQYRPQNPVRDEKGRERKYEFFSRRGTPIGMHPSFPTQWIDTTPVVLIAEGLLKADSALTGYLLANGCKRDDLAWTEKDSSGDHTANMKAARSRLAFLLDRIDPENRVLILSIGGVDNWKNNPEWRSIRLTKRSVMLGIDGDVATNPNVYRAAAELWDFLGKKKATPILIAPDVIGKDGKKVGLDDYLGDHGDWGMLLEHARASLGNKPVDRHKARMEKAKEASRAGFTLDATDLPLVEKSATEIARRAFAEIDPKVSEYIASRGTEEFPHTLAGLGKRVVEHFRGRIAYVPELDEVRVYDGNYWVTDRGSPGRLLKKATLAVAASIRTHEAGFAEARNEAVIEAARKVEVAKDNGMNSTMFEVELRAARRAARAEIDAFAKQCENTTSIFSFARTEVEGNLEVAEEKWNAHTLLVNTPSAGTWHVGKGVMLPYDPYRYITYRTAVDPAFGVENPDITAVLDNLDRQEPGTADMCLRYAGVGLTGMTDPKTFVSVVGASNAGKSTFWEAVYHTAGGRSTGAYGVWMSARAWDLNVSTGGHQDALHRARGYRFFIADEAEAIYCNTPDLKVAVAGGLMSTSAKGGSTETWQSRLSGVFLGEEQFTFPPGDRGFVNRMLPVAMTKPVEKRDQSLRHRLERAGDQQRVLLAKMLLAASEYYADYKRMELEGVEAPGRAALLPVGDVEALMAERQRNANPLTAFIETYAATGDESTLNNVGRAKAATWHLFFNSVAHSLGQKPLTKAKFDAYMSALGYDLGSPTEFKYAAPGHDPERPLHQKGRFREGVRFANVDQWMWWIDSNNQRRGA